MLVDKVNGVSVYVGEKTTFKFLTSTLHNVFLYLGIEKRKLLYVKKDLSISIVEISHDTVYIYVNKITLRIKEDVYQVNEGVLKPYDKNLCLINLVLKFIRLAYFKDFLSLGEL